MFESDGSRDECRGSCVWVFDSRAHRSSHRRRSYPAQVSDGKSWLHEHQFQVGLCFLSCKHDETWIQSKDFHSLLFDVPCMFLSYPTRPGNQILQKFNLTLPPCRTVAIVGESGGGKISIYPYIHPSIYLSIWPSIYLSQKLNIQMITTIMWILSPRSGKSTVAALLERFYDPSSGVVMLDGLDIRTLDPSWLRGHVIGFISQVDIFLSIHSNILAFSLCFICGK